MATYKKLFLYGSKYLPSLYVLNAEVIYSMNLQVCDVPLGYYSLALCILTNYTPEEAIAYFSEGRVSIKDTITDQDIENMIRLKATMTWEQIARIYGLSVPHGAYCKVRSYKKRKQKEANYEKAV